MSSNLAPELSQLLHDGLQTPTASSLSQVLLQVKVTVKLHSKNNCLSFNNSSMNGSDLTVLQVDPENVQQISDVADHRSKHSCAPNNSVRLSRDTDYSTSYSKRLTDSVSLKLIFFNLPLRQAAADSSHDKPDSSQH